MLKWFPLLLILASPVQANQLEKASQLFQNMEYARALRFAQKAIKSSSNGPEELVAIYRIQGLCYAALGKNDISLEVFKRLLAIDPDFRLSEDISPKLAAPFFQAVAIVRNQKPLQLKHDPPEAPKQLAGLKLMVTLTSNPYDLASRVSIRFRTQDTTKERRMSARVKGTGKLAFKLPSNITANEISYYFEVVNRFGGIIKRLGDTNEPLTLAVQTEPPLVADTQTPETNSTTETGDSYETDSSTNQQNGSVKISTLPPWAQGSSTEATNFDTGHTSSESSEESDQEDEVDSSTPWYASWWFWTAVGVVAAGATAGTIIALQDGSTPSGPVDYRIRIE